jgi:hypothetical protein
MGGVELLLCSSILSAVWDPRWMSHCCALSSFSLSQLFTFSSFPTDHEAAEGAELPPGSSPGPKRRTATRRGSVMTPNPLNAPAAASGT